MPVKWHTIQDSLPIDGVYIVRVVNGDTEIETTRRLRKGFWFGGCRPFNDGETVTHYQVDESDSAKSE